MKTQLKVIWIGFDHIQPNPGYLKQEFEDRGYQVVAEGSRPPVFQSVEWLFGQWRDDDPITPPENAHELAWVRIIDRGLTLTRSHLSQIMTSYQVAWWGVAWSDAPSKLKRLTPKEKLIQELAGLYPRFDRQTTSAVVERMAALQGVNLDQIKTIILNAGDRRTVEKILASLETVIPKRVKKGA